MRSRLFILVLLLIWSTGLVSCGGSPSPSTVRLAQGTATPASHGRPSSSFRLTGLIKHPGTFQLSNLQALPKITVETTTQPLGTHSFAGVLLYDFLQQAGIITTSTPKNEILRLSVLVTGTDLYAAAVALGEIHPRFANKKVLLAYEEDGKPLPTSDGFVRLVVPGDAAAGRYVSNVAQVDVSLHGPLPKQAATVLSTAFYLDGQVSKPTKYDLSALITQPSTQVSILSTDEKGQATATTYRGMLLNDLLNQAGVIQGTQKNGILRLGIVAVGSDGYSVLIAGGEISPKFGNLKILVAYSANGQPISRDGFARLVVPGDQAMGRFVSNLTELQVVTLATS